MSSSESKNPEGKSMVADCPKCGPNRYVDIVKYHRNRWDDKDEIIWSIDEYSILRCCGCKTFFFQQEHIFSEDTDYKVDRETGEFETFFPKRVTYWPTASKREQPEWSGMLHQIDRDLSLLFDDIYVAFDNDLYVMTAVGIRTAFDRATGLIGIDPALTFDNKLKELVTTGKIGKNEKDILGILTDAGSAAAHRGWRPKPCDLDDIISILEVFLHRTFFLGDAARKLKESIPTRQKPQPKAEK
jgi:hypothetical protein